MSLVTERTSVADVVARYPQCRAVFDEHGLKGCGGAHGPQESLGFFANVHGVDLQHLLKELNEAAANPSPSLPQRFAPDTSDTIYRRFFKGGIAVIFSIGCLWGALNLLSIAARKAFGTIDLAASIHAHANAMVFGWVGLFVMGFAYQSFPRLRYTKLRDPSLAIASFYLMLAGIALRVPAQLYAQRTVWYALGYVSAALQLGAVALFIGVIARTAMGGPAGGRSQVAHLPQQGFRFEFFLAASFLWLLLAALLNPVEFYLLARANTPELLHQVDVFCIPLRDIQLVGFAGLIIAGVSMRMIPSVYGARPGSDRKKLIFWLINSSLVLGMVSFVVAAHQGSRVAAFALQLSYLAVPVWAVLLVREVGIFGRVAEHDRSLKFVRAAFAWLIVAGLMLAASPLYNAMTGRGFSHAWLGAYRHAYTVGFISMLILGISSRVVPILAGVRSSELSALWPTFVLLNLGNALRVTTQALTDFTPRAYGVMGISGFIEVTGLAFWAWNLWRTMNRGRAEEKQCESAPPQLVRLGA